MKELEEARLKALAMVEDDRLKVANWIEWIHEGSEDAETNAQRLTNIALAAISKHCAKCMNLGGCYFLKRKMPQQPLHPNCHCKMKAIDQPIPIITAFAECPIEKITRWAFLDPAKKRFFENAGYNIIQASEIQKALEQQALEKYCKGEYVLGSLDDYGQRITILIELSLDGEKPLVFLTGWMVYSNGKILNTTAMASGDMKKTNQFMEDMKNERI